MGDGRDVRWQSDAMIIKSIVFKVSIQFKISIVFKTSIVLKISMLFRSSSTMKCEVCVNFRCLLHILRQSTYADCIGTRHAAPVSRILEGGRIGTFMRRLVS
jgi:hypothetical protein